MFKFCLFMTLYEEKIALAFSLLNLIARIFDCPNEFSAFLWFRKWSIYRKWKGKKIWNNRKKSIGITIALNDDNDNKDDCRHLSVVCVVAENELWTVHTDSNERMCWVYAKCLREQNDFQAIGTNQLMHKFVSNTRDVEEKNKKR